MSGCDSKIYNGTTLYCLESVESCDYVQILFNFVFVNELVCVWDCQFYMVENGVKYC